MKITKTTAENSYTDLKSRGILPDGLSLIKFQVTACTFRKKLTYKELGLSKDVEKRLASLGSKNVLDREKPKMFRNCKERAEALLERNGVQFSRSLWAVPTMVYSQVLGELQSIQQEALAIKNDIITNRDKYVEEFAQLAEALEPGFGEYVRKSAPEVSYLEGQMQCVVEGAEEMELTLAHKVLSSVADKARSYYEQLEKQRKQQNRNTFEVTKNTRKKLNEIKSFIKGMCFLDSSLDYMVVIMDRYISTLPQHHSDAKPEHNVGLVQLLINLQSPEQIRLLAIDDEDYNSESIVKPGPQMEQAKVKVVATTNPSESISLVKGGVNDTVESKKPVIEPQKVEKPVENKEPEIEIEQDFESFDLASLGFDVVN